MNLDLLSRRGGGFGVVDDVGLEILVGVDVEIDASRDASGFIFFVGETLLSRRADKMLFFYTPVGVA